jgi:hypothetical protein
MYEWVRRIHQYAGLLTFSAFVVWGVTGIHSVFLPSPDGYQPPEVAHQREVAFDAPGDLDDEELARHIYEALDLPLAGGHYDVHRDERADLVFFVFTVNGRRDVTWLEEQGRVRIAYRQRDLAGFLSSMHTAHSRRGPSAVPARLWAWYNEMSTWAFLFMTVSGVYMWLATRPGIPWARICAAASLVVTIALWLATR